MFTVLFFLDTSNNTCVSSGKENSYLYPFIDNLPGLRDNLINNM